MWPEETFNDLYDSYICDEKLALIAQANEITKVSVKTPWGTVSKREDFNNIIMQGTVLAPLECSNQIDKLGKDFEKDPEESAILIRYKNAVTIPPLSMVDDILTITKCGENSVAMNAKVQSFIQNKRLTLGTNKCNKMHFGKSKDICPKLTLNNENMNESNSQKYLGDVITNDMKIDENIKMRQSKGISTVNFVISMLKEITFGTHTFEIGMLLRNSMLVNGILYNMEAICEFKNTHLETLELSDKCFMQRLFECPRSTPSEAFYIEMSAMPLRFILQGRKFMYLWHLLKKENVELVKRVFNVQIEIPSENTWVHNIQKELKNYDINMNFTDIANMSKREFKSVVYVKVKQKSNQYLKMQQEKHTKTRNLEINDEMIPYLKTKLLNIHEKQNLFKLRSGMIETKWNFKGSFQSDMTCIFCKIENTIDCEKTLLGMYKSECTECDKSFQRKS